MRLVYDQPSLEKYLQSAFDVDAFEQQIASKSDAFSLNQREVLVDALVEQ